MSILQLSPHQKAEFLEAARLAGYWFVNTQNTPARPWGPVCPRDSADLGRFLEKTCPARDYRLTAGVWLQGITLAGLADLVNAPVLDKHLYRDAIDLGTRFLRSLQCFDVRWPRAIGGFHEVRPGEAYSAPRDAATGAMGLIALHRHTGQAEYLDRAIRFAEWYSTHGSDADGYPWDDFDLAKGEGVSRLRGDWQAGGGLVYYQLFKLTGDSRWKVALGRVLDVLEKICATAPGTDTAYDFHGNCILSVGNDDFATTVLLAGHQVFGKKSYLDLAAKRLRAEIARQAPNGAFPGYGGTFVTALELLEALDFAEAGVQVLPADELVKPLMAAATFGLSLQERTSPDRFMLGGVYGQSNYGTARDIVHSRDANYALQLWLRLAGHRAAAYTTLGWAK
ncbi:MAG: hypothetical protein PHU85_05580 [Phycisphaerae bacterium]|nr:hypothetical protein [Phycisphaerae bacterium]